MTRPARPVETSLGLPLEREGAAWVLDVSGLPLFHGLSVLSRALAEAATSQARSDRIDIDVERVVQPRENPELLHDFGVALVKVCAEHETVGSIAHHPERFEEHLRALLGTLQRRRYRDALFPRGAERSQALVFHFDFPAERGPEPVVLRFVLEFLPSRNPNYRGYLRVTIEDPRGRRLSLDSIPHLEVEDLDRRTFIAGSTRIAQTWSDGVRRAAENRRRSFSEQRSPYNFLFKQLDEAGLGHFEKVELSWGDDFMPTILEGQPTVLDDLMKKVLLALEDSEVRGLLARRETLRIDERDLSAYLESAQLSRVLHVGLGESRERVDIDHFLDRMPATGAIVQDPPARLGDVAVFLIHHMTADVLGVIAGLRQLGCRDLTTLFVAYAGEPPGSYLGPLLDLPCDEFRAYALTHIPERGSTEGQYRLSTQYSSLRGTERVAEALARNRPGFYGAMQSAAKLLFLEQLERARAAGRRCLVIEDGGYLAPELNRAALERERVCDFLRCEDPDARDARPLRTLLDGCLIGTTEHTRNGFDRLRGVDEQMGGLAYPAVSIAISKVKVEVESREVAVSVLNAVENVLHSCGLVLSRRRCLVLGSRGAIGRALVDVLRHRLDAGPDAIAGVDLRADDSPPPFDYAEATRYGALPDGARKRHDVVLGVIGRSILSGDHLAEWVLRGDARSLVLASGSTKTEEFKDAAHWVDALLGSQAPEIAGLPLRIEANEVIDPMSGRVFGHRYTLEIDGRTRELVFLANLMPVNFMFYGVPTELIDEVLAQLVSASLGLVRHAPRLTPRLHAVDWTVSERSEPLG